MYRQAGRFRLRPDGMPVPGAGERENQSLTWSAVSNVIYTRMTLLTDLEGLVRDHCPHSGMTGDATQPAWNGYRQTVAYSCVVVFDRWVTPEEADADLHRLATLN